MRELPVVSLTPEEQARRAEQMYLLLGSQVKSYHKHRRIGENTSVPVELARDLLESMEYTLNQTGTMGRSVEEDLRTGQQVLEEKLQAAQEMLRLVTATVPDWQTECRWDAIRCLDRYLAGYDHLHLAHRTPDVFYPILVPVPENLKGIDVCLYYLQILWLENQIIAGAGDLEDLWDLQDIGLNQCEQLLVNGVGKAVISREKGRFPFTERERDALGDALRNKTLEELHAILDRAADRLCQWLDLTDENAVAYAKAIVPQLAARLACGNLTAIFL